MFVLGAQYGLKPNELLDLNMGVLQAYIIGREEAQTDREVIAIQAGYWSGYYQGKKPKPLHTILKKIEAQRSYMKKNKSTTVETTQAAVDRFKELEAKRLGGGYR